VAVRKPSPLAEPRPGDVIAGKYRVERILGTGGMGVVLAARHLKLDELVAVKFLLGEHARNPEVVARFIREAWAAAKIKSDHVVRVLDVSTLEDGTPYLVMEHLDGEDLGAVVERGRLDVALAIDCVVQVCEAVAEAHQAGIVHRDLKPQNLFVTRRGDGCLRVKVLDFGISKVGDGPSLTQTDAVMGSPVYMAPEQLASSKNVDARADIWALGIILYQLLCGRLPFDGPTIAQVCTRVLYGAPLPLRDHGCTVPGPVEAAVLRCLAKMPADRFATVAELAAALAPHGSDEARRSAASIQRLVRQQRNAPAAGAIVASRPQAAPPAAPGTRLPDLATLASTDLAVTTGIEAQVRGRSRWVRIGAAAGVVAIAAAAVAVWPDDPASGGVATPSAPSPEAPATEAARAEEAADAPTAVASTTTGTNGPAASASAAPRPRRERRTPRGTAPAPPTPAVTASVDPWKTMTDDR
jgi:serine/threonine-protein kinase